MMTIERWLLFMRFIMNYMVSWPNLHKKKSMYFLAEFYRIVVAYGLSMSIFLQAVLFMIFSDSIDDIFESISVQILVCRHIIIQLLNQRHKSKFLKLYKILEDSLNGPKERREHWDSDFNLVSNMYRGYVTFVYSVYFLKMAEPMIQGIRKLPTPLWTPYSLDGSCYYIAYSAEVLVGSQVCCGAGLDAMFGLVVFHCFSSLKIIEKRLLKLTDDLQGPDIEAEVDRRLNDCVKLHIATFETLRTLNKCYRDNMTVFLLGATIAICAAAGQLLLSDQRLQTLIWSVSVMLVFFFNILMYCLPADLTNTQVKAVGNAAYSSNWDTLNLKSRKSILIMMIRSDLGTKLQSGRTDLLLLENYTTFITSTSYYFTSMRVVANM